MSWTKIVRTFCQKYLRLYSASWFDNGDKTLPGPGAHDNVRLDKTNPPGWKLGTSAERDTFLDKFHYQYPPPTDYNPKF